MKRRTFDPDAADVPLPPDGTAAVIAEEEGRRPCRWCGAPTLLSTLSQYGARCFRCYEAYGVAPQPPVCLADKRRDAKAWAWTLKAREERGEPLTQVQRDMWRMALCSQQREAENATETEVSP